MARNEDAAQGGGRIWTALNFPAAWLSLRPAGDLGPSGWDDGAATRRAAALAGWRGGDCVFPPAAERLIVCHQVHSLRVLGLIRGRDACLCEAAWDDRGVLAFSETPAGLPPGAAAWEDLGADLPRWAGGLDADGVVSDDPGLWLGVTVADCLPILLEAGLAGGRLRGALHSGWGGTGILAAALDLFDRLGADGARVHLGPCIAAADYPVPPERADLFARRFGPGAVLACADGQPGLDLAAANRALLDGSAPCLAGRVRGRAWAAAGRDIVQRRESTAATGELHSFRRDGAAGYGRMLCMIGARP